MTEAAWPAAVVTGAYGGIGLELAKGLQERGMHAILVGRDASRLEEARRGLPQPERATVVAVDLSEPAEAEAAIRLAADEHRVLRAAIACAAVHGPEGALEAVDYEAFDATLKVNVTGVLATCRAVVPAMRRQAAGNLVLFSSGAGTNMPRRELRSLAYQVSKFGVEGLVNGLAVQLRGTGVNVNGVRPGRTATGVNVRLGLPGLRRPRQAVEPVMFLATLAPGGLSGYVLEATAFEAGLRPERRDYTAVA